jgi:hypothetical protein
MSESKGHWADEKKQSTLKYFLSCGNLHKTSRDCLVPLSTLEQWKNQDWWKDGIKEIREGNLTQLDHKLTETLDLALDGVIDRIKKGEVSFDPKTGKKRATPAKLRDLNVAFNTLLDKRQLIRREPTRIVEQHSTAQQLSLLAKQFEEFVTGRQKTDKLQDITTLIEGETVIQAEDGTWEVVDNGTV